jgi:hypothetical protein
MEHDQRFCCGPEPSGTWTVWDKVTGAPATLGGGALEGRSEDRAKAACEILKRIYGNRLDAPSTHQAAESRAAAAARKRSEEGRRLLRARDYPIG